MEANGDDDKSPVRSLDDVANSDDHAAAPIPPPVAAPLQSPPFWKVHGRSVSGASFMSNRGGRPTPIQLEDHSEESHDQGRACWAKHVTIDDYTVVTGTTGIGAYVVWNCTVETLKGAPFTIRKRFSEFDKLRADLVRAFPHAEASIPPLPRKSVVSRFRVKFLEHRKAGLSHFLNCILLNPEFSGSPILREFVFDV
ncbi:PX-domain-containing protein [Myriangium duriaei CBS 260.36]|uniref:Endosomal/vacuolar adapter protein YPT35 n=1 Tax=Myriangium duriaei CBS 260.36 TaxID=1168546 RepID=A0A9P4J902_9PEZI|nr:PX-domain-containing protein [Myriangium duriaei CBS 260.36]